MNGKFSVRQQSWWKRGGVTGREGWGKGRVKTDSGPEGIQNYKCCHPAVRCRSGSSLINTKNILPLIQDFALAHELLRAANVGGSWSHFVGLALLATPLWGKTPSHSEAEGLMLYAAYSHFSPREPAIDSPAAAHASDFISLARVHSSIAG